MPGLHELQFYYLLNSLNLIDSIIFITEDFFLIAFFYSKHLIHMNVHQEILFIKHF